MILILRNRQHVRPVRLVLLRRMTRFALRYLAGVESGELGLHLVEAAEMAEVNQQFLRHSGATDVITFDHREVPDRMRSGDEPLHGEMFLCLDVALKQAAEFRTGWESELVRYVVHGLLHLLGFDDHQPKARRTMKREENRWVRAIEAEFVVSDLGRPPVRRRKSRILRNSVPRGRRLGTSPRVNRARRVRKATSRRGVP